MKMRFMNVGYICCSSTSFIKEITQKPQRRKLLASVVGAEKFPFLMANSQQPAVFVRG